MKYVNHLFAMNFRNHLGIIKMKPTSKNNFSVDSNPSTQEGKTEGSPA
jgi:hypothetical protein